MVSDKDQTPYHVYCDFSSELNFVYTLVTSWKFSNRMMIPFGTRGYNLDDPVNQFNPNWFSYRMSKSRMEQVRNLPGTTHWRITCNFDTLPGVDYRDYLRFKFMDFDPLSGTIGGCRKADYVNVMGSGCQSCEVFLRQHPNHSLSIESDPNLKTCSHTFLDVNGKKFKNLYNVFGLINIHHYNPNFRCHNHPDASTSLWFGGMYLSASEIADKKYYSLGADPILQG